MTYDAEPAAETEKALAVFEGHVVRPLTTVQEAQQDWQEYIDFCKSVLADDDYQKIAGKQYKKKSAWRKLARAFGITDDIEDKDIRRDDRGWPMFATFTVRATAQTGQSAMGYHEAHVQEKCCPAAFGKPCPRIKYQDHTCCPLDCDGWQHWSHPGDIPATAHTRAKNRAIADLIGAGEVSAEEMQGGQASERPAAARLVPRGGKKIAPAIVRFADGTEAEMAWPSFVSKWQQDGLTLEDLAAVVGKADSDHVTQWFGAEAGRTISSLKVEAVELHKRQEQPPAAEEGDDDEPAE